MTEYWKSYAKKYCDVCKCWITDNKASVQFHEGGKRHKENVAKKINDLVKKATKENKEKQQLDDDMKKMEEAALRAYMKDVEENPDHSAQYVREKLDSLQEQYQEQEESHSSGQTDKTKNSSKNMESDSQKLEEEGNEVESNAAADTEYISGIAANRVWYEALSDQGHTYYWNTQTNESVWQAPNGYVTLDEQRKEDKRQKVAVKEAENQKQATREKEEKTAKIRNEEVRAAVERERMRQKYAAPKSSHSVDHSTSSPEEEDDSVSAVMGPQARFDPYGAWSTVVPEVVEQVDLQLPPSYISPPQPATFTAVEPKVKIKEKTLDTTKLFSRNEPTSFKKRKISHKGNTRQRFDDDD